MNCITGVSHRILPAGFAPHAHQEHELIFVTSGAMRMKSSSGERIVRGPALVSIGHLEKHAVRAQGRYERYVLTLRPELLPAETGRLRMFFAPQLQVLPAEKILEPMRELFRMLLEEWERGDPEFPESGVWLLQSLLLLLYRSFPECFPSGSSAAAQLARQVQTALEAEPCAELSLRSLAREFHVSDSYLSHSFRSITGWGVMQYRMMVKLSAACELLLTTEESISAVGERAGFPDASSFARCFRKSLGCTPRQYRKRNGLSGAGG